MPLDRDQFIRYSRQLALDDIGEAGQQRLLDSTVAIVGVGGLGSPVALYLAAAGIGTLLLVDGDAVEKSNLQRSQLFADRDTGSCKVEAAATAIARLNPATEVVPFDIRLAADSIPDTFRSALLVLDCSDNSETRLVLNRLCLHHRIDFISASALGWEGQLCEFHFSDPRHRQPCLACLLSPDHADPPGGCELLGVLGPALGAIGSLQAARAIRLLAGVADTGAHGRLWRLDTQSMQWLDLAIKARPNCPHCSV